MLTSLALIFLVGLAVAALCQKLRLPRIIGMLFTGILLGPYVLNLLDPSILSVSADLRQLALVIILIKAGLSLNLRSLKRWAVRPCSCPACPPPLRFWPILSAGSGHLRRQLGGGRRHGGGAGGSVPGGGGPPDGHVDGRRLGDRNSSIPQMILAGSSMDDVYVIVLFSTFVGMAQGGTVGSLSAFAGIPISILLGIAVGAGVGWLLAGFFEYKLQPPSPHPQQHQGHHPPGHCLPPAGGGGLAGGDCSLLRHSGRHRHGLRRPPQVPPACVRPPVREVRQAVAGGGGSALRAGGCRSGHPLHPGGRSGRGPHHLCRPGHPGRGRLAGGARAPTSPPKSGSSVSSPTCPRPPFRRPSALSPWPWGCPAAIWCCLWPCWPFSSPRPWGPSAWTTPTAGCSAGPGKGKADAQAFLPSSKAFLLSSRNLGGTMASRDFCQASSGRSK